MSSVVMSFKPSSDSVGAHDTGGGPEDEEGTGVGGSGVTLAELDELAAALRGVFTSSLSRLVTTSDSVGSCESFLKVLRGGYRQYIHGTGRIPIKYHLKFFIAFPYCFILIKNVY
eukprot:CAMPEP_0114392954 /NCGR_PEP_ID=MMETSP0102-20121206/11169_1 /TAXON_ID=38822 ORGANISM="Pteridomonas danica, Strain PT" /NCGR_SAMPLE_ID=MMETSP0102 /ASSEMBLY_ACC=CAM_ASM_000212 /LENGTH=114 /DNA_ID=CAMNT_0001552359 /DNA_START=562 /DNA_END=906 /DNA_ORIENTATION=+